MIEVKLYTKSECCLCDAAKAAIKRVQQQIPFTLVEVDILSDQEAFALYKEEIPVILVAGRKAFKYRVDERRLKEILMRASRAF